MDRLSKFTAGLEDADVFVDSRVYLHTIPRGDEGVGSRVADKRLDMVLGQVNQKLEHQSVDLHAKSEVKPGARRQDGRPEEGYIRVQIKQKELKSDGSKTAQAGKRIGPRR